VSCIFVTAERPPQCYVSDVNEIGGLFHAAAGPNTEHRTAHRPPYPGHPVRMEAVPRDTWEGLFASQGMKNPTPRAQMLDGFNEGWIEFENGKQGSLKGQIEIETVLRQLVASG